MSLVISYGGRRALLTRVLPYLGGLTCRLYVINVTLAPDLNNAAFTEASFAGYRAVTLSSWPNPYLNPQGNAESDYRRLTWSVTSSGGSDSIWGYWFEDSLGNWIGAEVLPGGPIRMNVIGDTMSVSPRFLSGPLC